MGHLVPIDERTYAFALALLQAYKRARPADAAERAVWLQLLRAGTSVGANTAEAGGAQSRPDWLTRRHIALKEAREAQFWLRLMADAEVTLVPMAGLRKEANEIVAILTAIVKNAKSGKPSTKFPDGH